MPYIEQSRRPELDKSLDAIVLQILERPSHERCIITAHCLVSLLGLTSTWGPDRHNLLELTKTLRCRRDATQNIRGDVNYCVCRILCGVCKIHEDPSYDVIVWLKTCLTRTCEILRFEHGAGATECIATLDLVWGELRRRFVDGYEHKKMLENGDLFQMEVRK
jgi:hypothetical protein